MLQGSAWWGNVSYAYSLLSEYNKKHPGNITVLLSLAELTEQLGRFEESLVYWKALVAAQPKNHPLLAKFAWLKFSYDRPAASMLTPDNSQESENLLLRCIALTADTVDRYHIILGDIYFENQKYEDAAREYLRSAELRKRYAADSHFSLDVLFAKIAKALYYSGRNAQALEYAAQSSLLDPENTEVAKLIYKIVMKQSELFKSKSLNH
jgi:tetratricopeptide (TPR) repeat protein